ncbi:putative lipoprotein [Ralstonia phage AhaGv]|nr:putative lipoprotein [Ralstonia phage AhaGv]
MAAASTYTENNIINALLRGVAFPLPAKTYVSLHTGDPGVGAGANEVSLSNWPAYVRREAEQGGAIGSGWTPAASGQTSNVNQLTYPANNGVAAVTVTHYAVFDAPTGGNLLFKAPLTVARTLQVGDVFVFDVGSLTAQAS